MKRTPWLCIAALACGCGAGEDVDFSEGIPSQKMTQVNTPLKGSGAARESGSPGALTGTQAGRSVQGAVAGLYLLTAGSSALVNGTTAVILGALREVAKFPTSVEGNVAHYGPHTGALSPTTWRATLTRTNGNLFSYVLEGKAKDAADSSYVVVLSGQHTASRGQGAQGYGHGTFLIEWDKAGALPDVDRNAGTAEFTYGKDSPTDSLTVNVTYNQAFESEGVGGKSTATNAEYRYTEKPDTSGQFEFAVDGNMDWLDMNRPAKERWTLKSRWQADGAGRSDAQVNGGDHGSAESMSECWSPNFASVFLVETFDPGAGYGAEASACAYPSADFSKL